MEYSYQEAKRALIQHILQDAGRELSPSEIALAIHRMSYVERLDVIARYQEHHEEAPE